MKDENFNLSIAITGNLNINSFTNKFDQLREIGVKYVEVLLLLILHDTFPDTQFFFCCCCCFNGFFKPFCLGRNKRVGVTIYLREDIPSKLLTKHILPGDIKGILVELNFRKFKKILIGTYQGPSKNDHYSFENLDKALGVYSNYEKVLHAGISEVCLDSFLYQHELKNLVKEKTCFKDTYNPSCIYLFLTNNVLSFQHTESLFTSLFRLSYISLDCFKTTISKNKPFSTKIVRSSAL